MSLIRYLEGMGYSEEEVLLPILLGRVKTRDILRRPNSKILYFVSTMEYYVETEIGEFPLIPDSRGIICTTKK